MSQTNSLGSLNRWLAFGGLLLAVIAWCAVDWWVAIPKDRAATYVGRQSCAECHTTELTRWTGSHHDRAMELATDENVVGDFNDSEYERFGVKSKFFKRDGKYWVNTEGPDGEFQDFEIKYTFGIEPMQQYMVEFPDGRVQVLRVSWDTRKNEWFYVYPTDVVDERILPGDPLHWTGVGQNWNTMCADCHSTNVHKNFDLASNSYDTTFSEIDVSCETCHGPASIHVEIAESNSLFWDRNHGYGLAKLKGESNDPEIETCAPCHSRRTILHAEFQGGDHYFDYYHPSLVRAGLYHADGQILDEVYVYGSFTQSRMYREGVRCSDCHDPHSLELKFPDNRLCTQCHVEGKYDVYAHHRHTDKEATSCVVCHMPSETYMVIDDRRDHSMRIPRPDLTLELGTPNVCNECHTMPGEDAAWAAETIRKWYGDKRPDDPHYARALAAAERSDPEGMAKLKAVLRRKESSPIVRATAMQLMSNYTSEETDRLAIQVLKDKSSLVRAAAIEVLSSRAVKRYVVEISERLHDPVRLVRHAAAQRLVREAATLVESRFKQPLEEAVADYRRSQELVLDRAASHINLAKLSEDLGDLPAARDSLRTAVELEPYLSGVRLELARILELLGEAPQEVRQLRTEEVALMERDAGFLPGNSAPHYKKGMLHVLLEEVDEARESFEEACRLEPNRYENWVALVLICERQKDWNRALEVLDEMYARRPQDPAIRAILQNIQAAGGITPEMIRQAAEEKQEQQQSN